MIHKTTTIPFSYPTFNHGLAYAESYDLLKKFELPLYVIVTNGALAIELFLKSLTGNYVIRDVVEKVYTSDYEFFVGTSTQGVDRKSTHLFSKLYKNIPEEYLSKLTSIWKTLEIQECLKDRLERLSYDFVNSRYCDETGNKFNGSVQDYDELIELFKLYESSGGYSADSY
jgi:hypothetical protein